MNAVAERRSRLLIGPALVLASLGALGVALLFVLPRSDSDEPTEFDLGSADQFAIGSVTTIGEGRFHLVRLSQNEFVALSWTDPHAGCTVPWRPDFVWPNPETGIERSGWFRNPCHGETYDITGKRIFGPSPRDLDRFPVEVRGDNIVVRTDRYICGHGPGNAPCEPPSVASSPAIR